MTQQPAATSTRPRLGSAWAWRAIWLSCLGIAALAAQYGAARLGLPFASTIGGPLLGLGVVAAAFVLAGRLKANGVWLATFASAMLMAGLGAGLLIMAAVQPLPVQDEADAPAVALPQPSAEPSPPIAAPPGADLPYLQALGRLLADTQSPVLSSVADNLADSDAAAAVAALASAVESDDLAIKSLLLAYMGRRDAAIEAMRGAVAAVAAPARSALAARLGDLLYGQWLRGRSLDVLRVAVAANELAVAELGSAKVPKPALALATSLIVLADLGGGEQMPGLERAVLVLAGFDANSARLTAVDLRDLAFLRGAATRRLGMLRKDSESLERAGALLRSALDESEGAMAPEKRGAILNELGLAQRQLAVLADDDAYMAAAIDTYMAAREAMLAVPNETAAGVISMNLLLAIDLSRQGPPASLSFAENLAIIDTALTVTDPTSNESDWAYLQVLRGNLMLSEGADMLDSEQLLGAVEALRAGLTTAQTDGRSPQAWALAQNQLANALQALGQAQNDPTIIDDALQARSNAWVLYQYAGMDHYRFYFADRMAALITLRDNMTNALGSPLTLQPMP